MKPAVFHYSYTAARPEGHGFTEIGIGKVVRLSEDGVFSAFSFQWDFNTGSMFCRNVLRHHVSKWLQPDHMGGKAYDGKNLELIKSMQKAGLDGGAIGPIPGPLFYCEAADGHGLDCSNSIVRTMVLEAIGPEKVGVPFAASVSPGGVIDEVIIDGHEMFISYTHGEVQTLPSTARLRPWVAPGVELETGTEVADLVPRLEYTWERFLSLPENAVDSVLKEVIKIHTHEMSESVNIIPMVFLPIIERRREDVGGKVKAVFERALPYRKPVLVTGGTKVKNNLGFFDFDQNAWA